MKRFWTTVATEPCAGGWRVTLDGRAMRTQGKAAQVVPDEAMARALAAEWQAQGAEVDASAFPLRDMADYAIDVIAPDPAAAIAAILPYGETDTLCYRADLGEPLHLRQLEMWEPVLRAAEARWDVHFERVSGIIHRPQPAATLARFQAVLAAQDAFTLAALRNLSNLAASLTIALCAVEPGAQVAALWQAANLEEDWQADLWGKDAEAEALRDRRTVAFLGAVRFAGLVG
jgi:chaperone required for assembly of F1-ATPase